MPITPASKQQPSRNERRVFWAALVTGVFTIIETIGGILSGSLALLADAGHMLADTAALTLAWLAFRVSRKPADARRSYGYQRFQVLAALINGLALFFIVIWIFLEAIARFLEPVEILAGVMLAVAVAGLVINLLTFAILYGADHHNLNLRGALLHVWGDLLGSVAALTAAAVILVSGWTFIDPLLSLFVALLILRSAWILMKKSAHILLEGSPEWLNVEELRTQLIETVPDVEDIHHVHVWLLTSENPLLTLHANICQGGNYDQTLMAIKECLHQQFGIEHSTIQIETHRCADKTPSP
ncbi:cation diffusion facilitator family transporter [Nitrosococcus watsonii]|uniref:Cation diffusion facilitator family transporter n=1 Tax=Nitrosococcus watsoni (strain C-113) TaxID=105559 RepID=D8K9T9_NITWC|nr:cation diffusion facilitator family transporter [Nitrosococcus watsonii]ADJ29297.1 cation diffusion facilitator family transporter [Nitrosococcus watsonii C-113]